MKLYTEAILWFLNCGLLPEKTSARFQDLFPVRQLEKLYSTKRSKWQSKFAQWLKTNHFLAEELKNVGLLIDGLCKQLGSRLVVSKHRGGEIGCAGCAECTVAHALFDSLKNLNLLTALRGGGRYEKLVVPLCTDQTKNVDSAKWCILSKIPKRITTSAAPDTATPNFACFHHP